MPDWFVTPNQIYAFSGPADGMPHFLEKVRPFDGYQCKTPR